MRRDAVGRQYGHTCVGEKDIQLERFSLHHLKAGAGTDGGQPTGDGVDSVQRTGEDEVLVGG